MSVVYLVRDPKTNDIVYVGRGKNRYRPVSHLKGTHQGDLERFLERCHKQKLAPMIEVAGEFGSDAEAQQVEASLISALWGTGILNRRRESGEQFCPMLLPKSLEKRLHLDPLDRRSIRELGGAIVVNITPKTLGARPGALPTAYLDDAAIKERIDRWWQLKRFIDTWDGAQQTSPTLLLGVTGPPSRRWVLGSMRIQKRDWHSTETQSGGLAVVPTQECRTKMPMDASHLRGRRLALGAFGAKSSSGRKFNSIRSEQFDIVS